MFEESIREGKARPDFAGTDEYQVSLTLCGEIQDEAFLRFLERIGQETLASFSTTDLVVRDLVHRNQEIPKALASRVPLLLTLRAAAQPNRRNSSATGQGELATAFRDCVHSLDRIRAWQA